MTFGGVGGVVLLFWRGRGGDVLFNGGFGGACGCGCGGCWLKVGLCDGAGFAETA